MFYTKNGFVRIYTLFTLLYSLRWEESGQEAEELPVLLPIVETSDTADTEVDGPEKEEEVGIFQVLERLEEITSALTSR